MPYYSTCYKWEGWLVMTKLDFDDYLFPLEDELCIKIKGNILILKTNCYWFKWLIIDNWKTCLRFQVSSSRTTFLKSKIFLLDLNGFLLRKLQHNCTTKLYLSRRVKYCLEIEKNWLGDFQPQSVIWLKKDNKGYILLVLRMGKMKIGDLGNIHI